MCMCVSVCLYVYLLYPMEVVACVCCVSCCEWCCVRPLLDGLRLLCFDLGEIMPYKLTSPRPCSMSSKPSNFNPQPSTFNPTGVCARSQGKTPEELKVLLERQSETLDNVRQVSPSLSLSPSFPFSPPLPPSLSLPLSLPPFLSFSLSLSLPLSLLPTPTPSKNEQQAIACQQHPDSIHKLV